MKVTEDPVTGSHHRRSFALDEEPECVAIAGENRIDGSSFIGDLESAGGSGCWRQ